jgi:hypothetical protein
MAVLKSFKLPNKKTVTYETYAMDAKDAEAWTETGKPDEQKKAGDVIIIAKMTPC